MTWAAPCRRSGGRSERRSGAAQGQLHRLCPEGEDRRFGLDPDQVARIGPPPDHPARARRPRAGAGPRPGSPGRARRGPSRGAAPTARPGAHSPCARRPAHGAPAAPNGGCPTSGRGRRPASTGNDDQSRAHHRRVAQVTASAPTAARPAGERPSTQRSSCVAEELPSRTQREDSAIRQRTASSGERAVPPSSRRTAATPMDRRAVRADQANGCAAPRSAAASVAERGAHLVVGDAEADGSGPPHGQAGQLRLRLFEGGAPGGGVDGGDGRQQRVHEPAIHQRVSAVSGIAGRVPSHAAMCEAIARRCSSRTSSTP